MSITRQQPPIYVGALDKHHSNSSPELHRYPKNAPFGGTKIHHPHVTYSPPTRDKEKSALDTPAPRRAAPVPMMFDASTEAKLDKYAPVKDKTRQRMYIYSCMTSNNNVVKCILPI